MTESKYKELVEVVKKIENIENFTPPQKLALENNKVFEKNLLVVSPTASGKTLIGILAGINCILNKRKKSLYIVPLRSLASEKYKHLKEKYEKNLGIKVGIATGDYDSPSEYLKNFDFIVLTIEKLDSILRHKASWIKDIGCIIIDELHLISDKNRGPILEIVITKLKNAFKDRIQIIGLSATIPNYDELANWINAEVVYSDYRPTKLNEGVFFKNEIIYKDGFKEKIKPFKNRNKDILNLIDYIVSKKKKQALVFVRSRRESESLAEKLVNVIKDFISLEKNKLIKISSEILRVLDPPTPLCEKLAKVVKNGVAFHHAGLVSKQRELVEEGFKKGFIKVIVTTTTLAMGINLPSTYVILRDYTRFDKEEYRSKWISVMEYKQIVGRAGRPQYDKEGYGVIVAKKEEDIEKLFNYFINGELERVTSKISTEPILRFHTLGLINEGINSYSKLISFFKDTLYFTQIRDIEYLESIIKKILSELIGWGFIKSYIEDKEIVLEITKIGRRVAELYIDPLTAYNFIVGIKTISDVYNIEELEILDLVSRSNEIKGISVSKKEEEELIRKVIELEKRLLLPIPSKSIEFINYLEKFKATLVILDWINEKSEKEILEKYNVTPGELYNLRVNYEWMLYSLSEIIKILNLDRYLYTFVKKLEKRVKHGVREELLELVEIPGIGRSRARRLYNNGIKTLEDLKKTPTNKLASILGFVTAKKVKEFLESKG